MRLYAPTDVDALLARGLQWMCNGDPKRDDDLVPQAPIAWLEDAGEFTVVHNEADDRDEFQPDANGLWFFSEDDQGWIPAWEAEGDWVERGESATLWRRLTDEQTQALLDLHDGRRS